MSTAAFDSVSLYPGANQQVILGSILLPPDLKKVSEFGLQPAPEINAELEAANVRMLQLFYNGRTNTVTVYDLDGQTRTLP